MPPRRGHAGTIKKLRSIVIQRTGATLTAVKVTLNGTGTFRVRIGTADDMDLTNLLWEEIVTDTTVTLANPNVALLYEIIGSNKAKLFVTAATPTEEAIPGIKIEITGS